MLKLAFFNLFRHKARTLISLIAIAIGVMAIVVLVSVIDGIYFEVSNAIAQMQGVTVMQKDVPSPMFSQIDEDFVEKIEKIQGVNIAIPAIISNVKSIDNKSIQGFGAMGGMLIYGIDVKKELQAREQFVVANIIKGEDLEIGDEKKVLIGKTVADKYDKFVGSSIKVNGKKFKIKGIFEMNSPLMENTVLFSIDDARDLVSFPDEKISMMTLDLENPDEAENVIKLIKFRFGDKLEAYSSSDITQRIGDVLGNLRLVVFIVAAISAIVAGVGIINTMLMSVMERFKEIGALKAVGWTNENIMKMVIFESILIGVFGGIIGIILGFSAASATKEIIGITTYVGPLLVAQAFAFAIAISLIAGIYPAFIASKMDPIEALRAE